VRQLSANDAFMVYIQSPTTPNNMCGVQLYDPTTAPKGHVSFDDVREHIRRRLHLARAFREKLVRLPLDVDHPWWVDDADFDIDYHVRQITLPAPGGWRELWTEAARIHSQPFDLDRPLWQILMVQGLDDVPGTPAGSFALLWRMHHAVVDGKAGFEILSAAHDHAPDSAPPSPPARPWDPARPPSLRGLLARAGMATSGGRCGWRAPSAASFPRWAGWRRASAAQSSSGRPARRRALASTDRSLRSNASATDPGSRCTTFAGYAMRSRV